MSANGRRTGNKPWKHIYGVDRKYTARVDRAMERGQYTPPPHEQGTERLRKAALTGPDGAA